MKKIFLFSLVMFSLISIVFGIGFHTAEEILPGTFSTGDFTFDGSVGIGLANPNGVIEVKSNGLSRSPVRLRASGSNNLLFYLHEDADADSVVYMNDKTNTATIILHSSGSSSFNGGNVGIGTIDPSQKLTLDGNITFQSLDVTKPFYIGRNRGSTQSASSKIQFEEGGHAGNYDYDINFYTSPGGGGATTSKMLIKYSGNVGIGTENPSYRLQVGETSNYGYVDGTGAWQSSSDIRFKENIQNINNSLNKISQISGIKYNTLNDSKVQIGFSAQEIEQILPEIVSTNSQGYKGVAYAKITPVLVEAIKELDQENQNLKQELCQKDNSYSWC